MHLYWKLWLSVERETLRTTLTPFNPRAGFVMPLQWLSSINQSYLGCISDKWQFSKIVLFFWQPYLAGWRIWYFGLFSKQKLELDFFWHLLLQICFLVTVPVPFLTCFVSSLCSCCRKDAPTGFCFNLFHGELSFSYSFKLYRLCNSSFKLDWQWEDWKINASRICVFYTQ